MRYGPLLVKVATPTLMEIFLEREEREKRVRLYLSTITESFFTLSESLMNSGRRSLTRAHGPIFTDTFVRLLK